MTRTHRNSLFLVATLAVLGLASTSQAAWPRYRVSSSYSLPSAPAMRPVFVPVYPTDKYLQANPGVVPATYAPPAVNVPGMGAPAANYPPSLVAPPAISVPNSSFYPQTYNAPAYNTPAYTAPYSAQYQPQYTPYNYNAAPLTPAPTASYYNPQPYTPYQQPRPIQPYTGSTYAPQPTQAYGSYYQPTRPSSFYSPTPNYYPQQQPINYGQY
ncbi:hypothetical protein [Anatilimnocola floriformis]|uniref:hypothetical protein n=1 Tax=Anatilimnocola floriformis TaxID=2948575 RepID=UPI0020C49449|nr:hypothetical protein [Anatilimnocola floriformis]